MKEKIEYRGYTITIEFDENPEPPRSWGLGTIYSNHLDYCPDGHTIEEILECEDYLNDNDRFSWKKFGMDYVYLPVYAYIHSGIALSTRRDGLFRNRWDSGLFAVIAVSRDKVRKEWGDNYSEEEVLRKLEGEIQELDNYYNGEVYVYIVKDMYGDVVTSCGGYYDMDTMIWDAKAEIDAHIEEEMSNPKSKDNVMMAIVKLLNMIPNEERKNIRFLQDNGLIDVYEGEEKIMSLKPCKN